MREKETVDQGAAMLSDDVIDKGFCLLCVSTPVADAVTIDEITEVRMYRNHKAHARAYHFITLNLLVCNDTMHALSSCIHIIIGISLFTSN